MVRLAAPHLEKNPGRATAYYRAALQIKLLVNGTVALLLYMLAPDIATGIFENPNMAPMLRWVSLGLMGACLYNYALARVQAEIEAVVWQLRNHASLALWCGDNEIDAGMSRS